MFQSGMFNKRDGAKEMEKQGDRMFIRILGHKTGLSGWVLDMQSGNDLRTNFVFKEAAGECVASSEI